MRQRTVLFAVLAIGVGVALLWLLQRVTGVTGRELGLALARLRPPFLLAILAGIVLSTAAGAEKWRLVEGRLAGRHPERLHAFGLSALGSALGQFIPAAVASALVRGGGNRLLTGTGGRRGALASAWEQLFDIAVIGVAAVPALVALRLGDFRLFLFGAPIVAVVGDRLVGPGTRLAGRVLPRNVGPLLDPSLSLQLYRLSWIKLLALIGMILSVALATRSPIPLLPLAAAIPPVAVAGTLSFVPAGLGVNEWSFVLILGAFGIAPHVIATFALMNRLLVGGLSIAVGLGSAMLMRRAAPLAGRSGLVRDDAYRDRAAREPL